MLPQYNRHGDTCPNVRVPEATVPKVLLVCRWGQGVNSNTNYAGGQVGRMRQTVCSRQRRAYPI